MESLFGLLPLLVLVAVMVWMIVNQRRRHREVVAMQSSLAVGDEVVTVGGLIGRIDSADGPVIGLEVSPGVVVRVDRRTVSGRTSDVPGIATAVPSDADASAAVSDAADPTVPSTRGQD